MTEEATGDEAGDRIRVLSAELADQIAAGEVVERPSSVVKELVENAIDAGARRVEVELEAAGLERIVVCDDGRGIHPEDLPLAITRHATSKVRAAADLVDVITLGFRGEALASIAAVAHVVVESRRAGAQAGTRLVARPGLPPERELVGMPVGTRVEVLRLFANVPARRKFVRSEATEVGHCSETMLRLAISHPRVHLRLRHNGRTLLDLPGNELPERMASVLERHGRGRLARFEGTHEGVAVLALLAPPETALLRRNGLFVVVRRRAVQHRELAQIVEAAYGDALPSGRHPVACIVVDPPPGTVDVNVHPQKAEVRFSDPQRVYAAVRHVLAPLHAGFPSEADDTGASPEPAGSVRRVGPELAVALDRWGGAGGVAGSGEPSSRASYRLHTRATEADYASARRVLGVEAQALAHGSRMPFVHGTASDAGTNPRDRDVYGERMRAKLAEPGRDMFGEQAEDRDLETYAANRDGDAAADTDPSLALLTCLPGPVAVFRDRDDLLVVDLRRLRTHLVYLRLRADLGGVGIEAQFLLEPVLVHRTHDEVALVMAEAGALAELGLVVESFGDDTLRVRAVPARLRHCVEQADVADLVERMLPWLRMRKHGDRERDDALRALAATRGADPAPRLARRWLRELADEGVDVDRLPGVRRLDVGALLG